MSERISQSGSRRFLPLLLVVLAILLSVLVSQHLRMDRLRKPESGARSLAEAHEELIDAALSDDVERMRKALVAGADPNLFMDGKSLLHRSIERGQTDMIELLLEFGADVGGIARLSDLPPTQGPLLFAAVESPQPDQTRFEMIRLLVQHGADVGAESYGRSAMDVAISRSDPEAAQFLRELGAPYGAREMAEFNRLDELRIVVEQDPEVIHMRFRPFHAGLGQTLLGIALKRKQREMAEFLIESGAPLDTVEPLQRPLLHLAAQTGDPKLIRLLVSRGLDVNAKDDYYRETPLFKSVYSAPPEAVSILIDAGADVNAQNSSGETVLHEAVRSLSARTEDSEAYSKRVEVIRLLIAAGADPLIPDFRGESVLLWARDNSPKIKAILDESAPHRD